MAIMNYAYNEAKLPLPLHFIRTVFYCMSFWLSVIVSPRVRILLGQPLRQEPGQVQFYGEVSQLLVFPEQIGETYISSLSKTCLPGTGFTHTWLELLANIRGDLEVIEPSACGGERCPPGYKGYDCSIKVDKNPPTVHGCPGDFRVVSQSRLSQVNWTEPIFSDDVGVINVFQSHRPGKWTLTFLQ